MFILSKKFGGLGNRLILSAHILASAIENNHSFYNIAFYDYARYFQATSQNIFCHFPIKKSLIKNHKSIGYLLYKLNRIIVLFLLKSKRLGYNSKNIILLVSDYKCHNHERIDLDTTSSIYAGKQIVIFQGWNFRGYKNLEKHGDKIRDYFKPLASYQRSVDYLISDLKKNCDILIGIAIRHGDYRQWKGGKYFYPLNSYVEFMQQLNILFADKKVTFLICSNEEQDTSAFEGFDFFFHHGHMIEDLYLLAACDYLVSPPSTYGMWASFYGKVPFCMIVSPDQSISLDNFKVCEL